MEPRVKNLLLNDGGASRRRDEQTRTSQRIASSAPPVDPQIDNSADSNPIARRLRSHGGDNSKSWRSTVDANSSLSHPKSPEDSRPTTRRNAKSGAPLAEVLNSNSNHSRQDPDQEDGRPRKSRRLEAESTRTLPRPSAYNRDDGSNKTALPPMLAPLHNPPSHSGIIPSMTSERFMPSLDSHSALPHASQAERDAIAALQQAREMSPSNRIDQDLSLDVVEGAEREDFPMDQENGGENASARPGKKGRRSKWTAEETNYLIQGVAQFGIGSWKKILKHPDFKFKDGRSSIDLKDRFRTCFPDEYRKSGSQTGRIESTMDDNGKRRGRGSRTTVELQKMGVKENMDFPKLDRRQRKKFTKEEDDALLRGFLKYPAQWKKIQSDPVLGLSHRTRTDLRDRFRNRFPQRFKEAGYKHRAKQGGTTPASSAVREQEIAQEILKESAAASSSKSRQPKYPMSEEMELATLLIRHNNATQEPLGLGSKEDTAYPLQLLTDPYDPELPNSPMSPDEDGTTQLGRDIFDWAARNGRQPNGSSHRYADPTTLTTFEAYHINPLLAQDRSNNPSTLPLSRILNADDRSSEI
jgi:Myb-like DNA-binding protein